MSHLVVLNLGNGDWQQGYPSVIAQLWTGDRPTPVQWTGSLPPEPQLGRLYGQWQSLYEALYATRQWRTTRAPSGFEVEDDEDYATDISDATFTQLCQEIRQRLNQWLNSDEFQTIERALRTHLSPADSIRLILTSGHRALLRLPWCLWRFLDDYPAAELALSLPNYSRSIQSLPRSSNGAVNILAILGNGQGIDIAQDYALLSHLPQTSLTGLVEPAASQVHEHLWEQPWDLLFFAGHSSSQGTGRIWINATDSLTIEQLRYGLKKAVAQGLKLAIFNSCDGLELAWDLADLQIPQVVVMREPVPDRVAQEFLKHFLMAFSGGRSLHQSVREARERLQALESEFPCATWLPTLCQNPAELPPTWQDWLTPTPSPPSTPPLSPHPPAPSTPPQRSPVAPLLQTLSLAALLVLVRSLGGLQALELWAFDWFLALRPQEVADPRLLIVTIDEADIQAQDSPERRGSLSDVALSQLLTRLEQDGARTIGLDLYRDYAISDPRSPLVNQLQQNPRLIGICKSSNRAYDPVGIAPPPELPVDQVGFSDFLEDSDRTVRRQLLFLTPDPLSPCTAPYSFNARLAFSYLSAEGITPQFTGEGNLQLGETVFHRLTSHSGGFQRIDARGNQLVLNYRSLPDPRAIAPQVSLTDVLQGEVPAQAIRDRLVLIGVTALSGGDYWATPYGDRPLERLPGVVVQAHMTSQILSAVLDDRPLIWTWPFWGDVLWIVGWTGVGAIAVGQGRSPWQRGGILVIILGSVTTVCFVVLLQGGWLPLVPAVLGAGLAGVWRGYGIVKLG